MNPTRLRIGFYFVPLGLGFIRLLAALPPGLGMAIGRLIATLLFYTAKNRCLVCKRNIAVCFPELDLFEQRNLVKDKIHGPRQELLEQAVKKGRGSLLLCPHYSMLDLVALLMHAVAQPECLALSVFFSTYTVMITAAITSHLSRYLLTIHTKMRSRMSVH
jgi:KDO2-lipid IV(A) lauroyltransferase